MKPKSANGRHLLGGGTYDNLLTHRLVMDEYRLSLVPSGIPWTMMFVTNCLFVAFFSTMIYLATLGDNSTWTYFAIAGIAITTCTCFDIYTYVKFRNAAERGTIFVYEHSSGKIKLPDQGLTFSFDEEVHIECITARAKGVSFGDLNSELNFVLLRNGVEKRWNLLRSVATTRPFGKLTKQLKEELPIPVRRV